MGVVALSSPMRTSQKYSVLCYFLRFILKAKGKLKYIQRFSSHSNTWSHSSTGLLLEMGSAKCVGDKTLILISTALKYTSPTAMGKRWPICL